MRKKFQWKEWKPPVHMYSKYTEDIDMDDDDESIFDDVGEKSGINLFVLDTNFIILFDVVQSIIEEKIPGLEVLKPITSYKMLVGVPDSGFFNANDVKKRIEQAFLNHDYQITNEFLMLVEFKFNEIITQNAEEIISSLYDSQDYWIFYIYPNGQFEIVTDISESEYYLSMYQNLFMLTNLIGGLLLSSMDYAVLIDE